jgi:SAM-dependent methyltransferase
MDAPTKPNFAANGQIFDRHVLRLRRARAASDFGAYDFLKQEVAERLAERLDPIKRQFPRALDLGCHNGALARALSGRAGIEWIAAQDLSPAFAKSAFGSALAGDEEALPFADGSLDLVASALSLHWVNDLPGALIQINRALRPDGLFIGALFGIGTLVELRSVLADAELELLGGASPHISPFLDAREGAGLLQRAHFALPVADTETITVTYGNPYRLIRDLRGMGEANALIHRPRKPIATQVLARALALYAERFSDDQGRVKASFEIVTLTGWGPHEAQQKPLSPGSAKMRLADALSAKRQD